MQRGRHDNIERTPCWCCGRQVPWDLPLLCVNGYWLCDHCNDDYFDAELAFNEWFESYYAEKGP